MARVDDVAAYILYRLGEATTMKLQKLLYYAQGWHLAWDEKPLFSSPIQAWANGPVVPEIFAQHRGRFEVSEWPSGNSQALSASEKETVDAVLEGYGHLTGQQLGDKTHGERPWIEARGETPPGEKCREEISLDTMQDYFSGLDQDNI